MHVYYDFWQIQLSGNISTRRSSKHLSQLQKRKKAFVFTSNVQNMACETESLIVYICVSRCFILYRILWNLQSVVCFLLWLNVLTHIVSPRQSWTLTRQNPTTYGWTVYEILEGFSFETIDRGNGASWTKLQYWYLYLYICTCISFSMQQNFCQVLWDQK